MLRSGLALLAACLLLLAGGGESHGQTAGRRELRVAIDPAHPPFSSMNEHGGFTGFDVDIVRALCRVMAARCELMPAGLADMAPLLQRRAVDLVPSLLITDDRLAAMDFTQPYYQATYRFVARRGALYDTSPAGMSGRVIGVRRDAAADRFVSRAYGGTATIQRNGDVEQLFLDLALDRVDALLIDTATARERFLDTQLGAGFDFAGGVIADPDYLSRGTGIAVRKGDDELKRALDAALARIRASSTFDAIRGRYFDEDGS